MMEFMKSQTQYNGAMIKCKWWNDIMLDMMIHWHHEPWICKYVWWVGKELRNNIRFGTNNISSWVKCKLCTGGDI